MKKETVNERADRIAKHTRLFKKETCRMCGRHTETVFNIDLKEAHLCELCERRIVLQSIQDYYVKD